MITPSTVVRRRLTARMRNFRGSLLVAGPDYSAELSDSAEFVFRSIDGRRAVAEIATLLAAEYEIPLSTAVEDVTGLVAELVHAHVLEIVEVAVR